MGPSSDSETGAQALAAGQKVKEDTRDDDSVQPSKRPRRAKGQGQAKATAAKAGAKASPPKLEASKEEPPDTVPGEGQSALAAPVDSAASAQDETPSQEEEDSGKLSEEQKKELDKLVGKKVPPVIDRAKSQLAEKGINLADLTADQLKNELPRETMKQLFQSYGYVLKTSCPLIHSAYNKKTESERRQWLVKYIIDPTSGGCSGKSTIELTNSTKEEGTVEWITLKQMEGPNYANDPEHAALYAQVLEERPHEIPLFAENKIKQYKWSKEIIARINMRNEKTAIQTRSDMEASDYQRIRDSMLNASPITDASASSNGAADDGRRDKKDKKEKKEKKEKKDNKDEDPEVTAKKDALKVLDDEIKKGKLWARKTTDELAEVPSICARMKKKNYPEAMTTFLLGRAAEFRKLTDDFVQGEYTAAKGVYNDAKKHSTEEINSETKKLRVKLNANEAKFNSWKKDNLDDIKKIA
ncbi:unnamed protein product [Prorocentrum cordatum]|uniref:Uncharacterized protein n=1 Tax=Prorocentrum cordatum TaxID=2364126 RepID=A0ABN9TNQ9_9DINO|nr:unnamed protein product [Polarella glacialis]